MNMKVCLGLKLYYNFDQHRNIEWKWQNFKYTITNLQFCLCNLALALWRVGVARRPSPSTIMFTTSAWRAMQRCNWQMEPFTRGKCKTDFSTEKVPSTGPTDLSTMASLPIPRFKVSGPWNGRMATSTKARSRTARSMVSGSSPAAPRATPTMDSGAMESRRAKAKSSTEIILPMKGNSLATRRMGGAKCFTPPKISMRATGSMTKGMASAPWAGPAPLRSTWATGNKTFLMAMANIIGMKTKLSLKPSRTSTRDNGRMAKGMALGASSMPVVANSKAFLLTTSNKALD